MLRLALSLSVLLIIAFIALDRQNLELTKYPKIPEQSANSSGISYLNELRSSVDLPAFSSSKSLDLAAQNHANYLVKLGYVSHDEREQNELFTGFDPPSRALKAGHKTSFVVENISARHLSIDESIDGLMSAIYHRFNFLNYAFDEIGYFNTAEFYVFEMSNSRISRLCERGDSIGQWYVTQICDVKRKPISKENFELATKPKNPEFLLFPNKKAKSLAVFGSEDPDPLPQCEISSAPVSLEFNPNKKVRLRDFKLYKNGVELENTFILSKENDPNAKLNDNQFALFSLLPFEFGTEYEIYANYEIDGRRKELKESFKTKEPIYAYFVLENNDVIELEAGQKYELFFAPKNCNDVISEYKYKLPFGAKFSAIDSGPNMLRVSVSGANNDIIEFNSNSHNIKIKIKNKENFLEFWHILAGILAIISLMIILRKAKK